MPLPNVETYLLPYTLIWNPLVQFQTFLGSSVQCSRVDCKSKIHLVQWHVGHSDGRCPRLLHDLNHMVLLLPAVYGCDNGHEGLSTDPCILKQFQFILVHRSGVTREFARIIIALCMEGLSFTATERFTNTWRSEFSITGQNVQPLQTLQSIIHLHQPHPSNDLMTIAFFTIL